MKLTISYAELQEYVASHFHKTVNVGYVDGKTVSVSLPIKVFGFTKSVSINVGVEKIEGTDLYLSYDGKMGIDLLVSPAISYAKRLVPEKAGWVEQRPGNYSKAISASMLSGAKRIVLSATFSNTFCSLSRSPRRSFTMLPDLCSTHPAFSGTSRLA